MRRNATIAYCALCIATYRVDEYVTKINQVTAEQVRDVARKYLVEDHLSIAYLEPQTINSTVEKKGAK